MKRKIIFYLWMPAVTCFLFLMTNSCNDEDKHSIIKEKITGSVQKGPFINGTAIQMSELSSALEQTGNNFTTQIRNNAGTFEIPDLELSSCYVRLSANGYYFDEVKGELSVSPLNLLALSDITDISSVNVNILTHLEKQRVEYLTGTGMSFSTAKAMAQSDVLSVFGLSMGTTNASETLDISTNSEGNAILLAISVILQGNLSVGDMTELMANIINDIREDGIMDDESLIADLRASTMELPLAEIRSALENRYTELGIDATIPAFEEKVNEFLEFTGNSPSVTEQSVTRLTTESATLNGVVNPNSLSTYITFEYGTSDSYGNTVSDTHNPLDGFDPINTSGQIAGLTPSTTYHYRVRANNNKGTTYGPDQTFVTLATSDCAVDPNGYVYKSVLIGDQIWMAENLKTTKFNDGTPIPKEEAFPEWGPLSTPAYCWYNNDSVNNYSTYGALYNFYTVNTGSLCPDGWHVPDDDEWTTLINYLGGKDNAGGKLKETGYIHWIEPNTGATDESGFTALPAGCRSESGGFVNLQSIGEYWSSDIFTYKTNTWAITRRLSYDKSAGLKADVVFNKGLSVRCIMD